MAARRARHSIEATSTVTTPALSAHPVRTPVNSPNAPNSAATRKNSPPKTSPRPRPLFAATRS